MHNSQPIPASRNSLGTGWSKQRIGLALGPVLFLIVELIPTPADMSTVAASQSLPPWAPQFGLGILLWIVVWWTTECVPLGLAALLAPMAFSIAGLVSWPDALGSYTHPIIWIFFAGFALAAAFQKWGLDRRFSYRLGSIYRGDNPRVAAFFAAALPVFLLTMTGSITGSTAVVYPMVLAFLATLGVGKNSRYGTGTLVLLGQAATAGAMLLLISTLPNLVTKAAVERAVPGATITFSDWLIVGTPQAVAGLLISWAVVFFLIRPEVKSLQGARERFSEGLRELGPASRGEKMVALVLITIIVLWVVPSAIRALSYSNPSLAPAATILAQILPETVPALLALIALALLRAEGKPLLGWDEGLRAIDWSIVFLFGGGIALGLGLERSGFAAWLGQVGTLWAGPAPSTFTIFAIAALIGFGLTYAASNTAACIISTSVASSLALGAGVNPIPAILAAGIASNISSALPSTTPPMAIVYGSGQIRMRDMLRVGIVSDLLRLTVLLATGPFLADLLCACKGIG